LRATINSALNPCPGTAIIFVQSRNEKREGWMRTVLSNVRVAVDGTTPPSPVNLLVDGTRIVAISEDPFPTGPSDHVIDGRGKLAIRGFVNAHTHLPMVLFRGLAEDIPLKTWLKDHIWPIERTLQPEEIYWASLLGLAEMIRTGTTLFADMYFHCDEIGRAVEEAGLRVRLSYGIIASSMDEGGKTEMTKAEAVIRHWENAAEGRIKTAVSPHAVYTCGEEVWTAAIELARKHDVPIHTHLAESEEEVQWCRKEKDDTPVAVLDRLGALSAQTIAAHCVHVSDEDITLLADRSVSVVHCPKSNAKLGNGIAPIAAMRKAGVRVALGTDGAATNNSLDMIEEMRMATLLAKAATGDPAALPAPEAVQMACEAGAQALGGTGETLAVGQPADIVLVDLDRVHTLPGYNPFSDLVYATHACDVTDVLVAGKPLLRNGELTTIDEEKVKREVKHLSHKYRN